MDYNEWLMNLYITNMGPITSSEWFRITMGVLQGGGMAASFLAIIIEFIGKEQIQLWLIQLRIYWEWDAVKAIGNGEWLVYKKNAGCTDPSVCSE